MIRSILWFRQDLRLHDNEALLEAIRSSDELIPVYIFDPDHFVTHTPYKSPKSGVARARFLVECVSDLRSRLRAIGSDLVVRTGKPQELLCNLALDFHAHYVYCNRERTKEEVTVQDQLEKNLWAIGREMRYSRGKMLYYTSDLPFPVTHCPDSYTVFRKEIEQAIPVRKPLETPTEIPKLPEGIESGKIPEWNDLVPPDQQQDQKFFEGGETAGLNALKNGVHPGKNFLPHEGSLLSPWISLGCLSPKLVFYDAFNTENGDEIQQRLIYRDYLRLMGKKYSDLIFHSSGIKGIKLNTVYDRNALIKWKHGQTGIDIIDAAMHQLTQSGWLNDTLRRLVAGYFLRVLNLDWRLGAAFFEAVSIDYDPCTNWVSWQNLAGIGPDTREDRIINYQAMGKRIDPEGFYTTTWNAHSN